MMLSLKNVTETRKWNWWSSLSYQETLCSLLCQRCAGNTGAILQPWNHQQCHKTARPGNLCSIGHSISVVLFCINKADLDIVSSWPLIFFSFKCISTGQRKSLLDALKALSITYQNQCLPFNVCSPVDSNDVPWGLRKTCSTSLYVRGCGVLTLRQVLILLSAFWGCTLMRYIDVCYP